MTTTIEERVSRLAGSYEHLATKADLAELKVELIKWMVGLMVGSVAVASSIALFVQRLIG